jgi:hypothetical protein
MRALVSIVAEIPETVFGGVAGARVESDVVITVEGLDDDPPALAELESTTVGIPEAGLVFGGGKSSCDIAITTSERNRARKKRLSIQGTGS